MVQNPVLERVNCSSSNNKTTVTISWKPIEGAGYFYAGVFNPDNSSVAHLMVNSSNGSNVANIQNITLDSTTEYTAKVAQCDASGKLTSAYSLPLNVLQNPLTNLSTNNNLNSIDVTATLPTVGNATGMSLTLVDANYNVLANKEVTGNSGTIIPTTPLSPSKTYLLYAAPTSNGGTSEGPSSEINLVMNEAEIKKVSYDGNNLTILSDQNLPTGYQLFGAWMAGNETITSNTGSESSVSMTQDWTKLNRAKTYTVLLRAEQNGSYGPSSQVTPIVVTPLNLRTASFTDNNVGVTWEVPPVSPIPTGGTIAAIANGSVAGTPEESLGYKGNIDISSVDAVASLLVQVNSVYGVAYGPPASTDIPYTAPTITTLSLTAGKINVAWNAVDSVPGYRLTLNDSNGKPISSIDTTDIQAALPAALNENAAYRVSVQAYGESNGILLTGPLSTEVAAISALPVINKLTTDRITNKSTLEWHTVSGANQYLINFSNGDEPVIVTATNYTFPEPMFDKIDLSFTITPQAKTTGVTVAGPASQAFKFPGKQPGVDKVYFNGLTANIKWYLIDNATSYTAAVLETKDGQVTEVKNNTVSATKNNTDIDFTIDADASYQIVVQALFGDSSGPTSQAMPLFENGIFPSNSPSTSCFPFVYPATELAQVMQADTAKTGIPITLYLPDIGAGTALTNLPYTVGAFTLAAYDGTGKENYPYTLTISNTVDTNNPWRFDSSPIRTPIQNNYVDFLKGAETNGAKSWGINQLQQIIARAMPQTFAELLYYNYGLNFQGTTVKGSADLRPGMILRVSINPFQMVTSQNSQSWNNGFIGGPFVDYEIGSLQNPNGSWGVGFDAFISQLVSNGALSVNPPEANSGSGKEQGVADGADLYFPAFREPFYRLFIPSTLISASSTGSTQTADNFVLAAASDYTALTTTNNTPGSGMNVAYFRGRAVIKICIRITVNNETNVVPIGTTVGNLLERSNQLPPAANLPLSGIKLERPLGPIVLDPSVSLDINNQYPVRLDWQGMAMYGPNWDRLNMPVLAGDQLTIANGDLE